MTSRKERNAAAIALIDKWLAEKSDYDEATWLRIKAAIEANRTSYRKRFSCDIGCDEAITSGGEL